MPSSKIGQVERALWNSGVKKNGLTATASHLAQATSTAIPLQDWVAKGFFFSSWAMSVSQRSMELI